MELVPGAAYLIFPVFKKKSWLLYGKFWSQIVCLPIEKNYFVWKIKKNV